MIKRMKYSKVLDNTDTLQRIEKGGEVFSNAIEISKNEHNCLSVGLKVFVLGTTAAEELTENDWGVPSGN